MSEYPSNCLILCPKCNNYPLLSLDKEKLNDILIKCDQCGYDQSTSLHNYLDQLKPPSTVIKSEINCEIHNEQLIRYCVTCKSNLCFKCNNHQKHQ